MLHDRHVQETCELFNIAVYVISNLAMPLYIMTEDSLSCSFLFYSFYSGAFCTAPNVHAIQETYLFTEEPAVCKVEQKKMINSADYLVKGYQNSISSIFDGHACVLNFMQITGSRAAIYTYKYFTRHLIKSFGIHLCYIAQHSFQEFITLLTSVSVLNTELESRTKALLTNFMISKRRKKGSTALSNINVSVYMHQSTMHSLVRNLQTFSSCLG